MAKLNAPLFSFNASGKIANALVYFCWKGIDVVRSYVVPANPQSTAQQLQRGYLKAAVTAIHSAQAHATHPLAAPGVTGYSLLGSTYPTPRTWFNTIVKQWIDQKILGKIPGVYSWVCITPGSTVIELRADFFEESSDLTHVNIWWGTSKTALINSVEWTRAELLTAKDLVGLTNGTKYFFQIRATTPDTFVGTNSGIFHSTPAA